MKKILLACTLGCSLIASAQLKEGRIVYERIAQLPVRTFRDVDPEIAKQIPKSRTDQFELLFNSEHALWQFLPSTENENGEQTFASGGMVMRFSAGSNEVSYVNFGQGTKTDQREVMQRSFVVSDSISKLPWKLTEESKSILTYTCRKATSTRVTTRMQMTMENGELKRTPIQDTQTVAAWFTTDIPVPAGPEYSGQLPGAILELDIANGQTVYRAIELSPKVNAGKIKPPKEGKKVSAAEFTKEREKIIEEMQKNMGNGGGMRIRTMQ